MALLHWKLRIVLSCISREMAATIRKSQLNPAAWTELEARPGMELTPGKTGLKRKPEEDVALSRSQKKNLRKKLKRQSMQVRSSFYVTFSATPPNPLDMVS